METSSLFTTDKSKKMGMVSSAATMLSSIALIGGLFLTWVRFGNDFPVLITGWAFDPIYSRFELAAAVVCGLAGLANIFRLVSNRMRSNVVLCGGLVAVALMIFRGLYIQADLSRSADMIWQFDVGFWLCAAGSALLVASSLLSRR